MSYPTIELIEGEFYWVKPAYGNAKGRWVVLEWRTAFWLDMKEVTPLAISGPITRPTGHTPAKGRDFAVFAKPNTSKGEA